MSEIKQGVELQDIDTMKGARKERYDRVSGFSDQIVALLPETFDAPEVLEGLMGTFRRIVNAGVKENALDLTAVVFALSVLAEQVVRDNPKSGLLFAPDGGRIQ